jgi:hypothetical protein
MSMPRYCGPEAVVGCARSDTTAPCRPRRPEVQPSPIVYAGSQDSLYYPFNFVQISPKIVHQSLVKKWICSYCDRAAIDSFLSQWLWLLIKCGLSPGMVGVGAGCQLPPLIQVLHCQAGDVYLRPSIIICLYAWWDNVLLDQFGYIFAYILWSRPVMYYGYKIILNLGSNYSTDNTFLVDYTRANRWRNRINYCILLALTAPLKFCLTNIDLIPSFSTALFH